MGFRLPGAFVFSLLLIGAKAADVGDPCHDADPCSASTLECDKVHQKCLLKVDEQCTGGSDHKCVFGASCDAANGASGQCRCSTDYTANADKLCEAQVGTDCVAGVTCVDSSVCDKVAGKCLLEVEQPCKGDNEENCVSGASCGTANCECGAAYNENNKLCVPKTPGNVGTSCTTNNECTTDNSECSSLKACKCKNGFVLNIANGECVAEHTIGTPCTPNDNTQGDCADDNAICPVTGRCECKTGFTGPTGGSCSKAVGTACTASDTCVDSSVCDKVAGKCLLKADEPCKDGNEDNCVFGASCGTANCECGAGYNKNTNTKLCEPKTTGNVGTSCTSEGNQCKTPNSECGPLTVCICKSGFVLNISNGQCDGLVGTACAAGHTCVDSSVCDKVAGKCLLKAEQPCKSGHEENCVSGASCGNTICECGGGYNMNSNKQCEPKTIGNVGTTCTSTGNECTTPNSVCSSLGACKCSNGFVLNIANGQCSREAGSENGSTPGVASSLLLCFLLATTSIVVAVVQ